MNLCETFFFLLGMLVVGKTNSSLTFKRALYLDSGKHLNGQKLSARALPGLKLRYQLMLEGVGTLACLTNIGRAYLPLTFQLQAQPYRRIWLACTVAATLPTSFMFML